MTNDNTVNRLQYAQKRKVEEVLRRHCKKGNDGFALYDEGFNDDRIAEIANAELRHELDGRVVTSWTVRSIRSDVLGNMRSPSEGRQSITQLRQEIEALKNRVDILEREMRHRGMTAPLPFRA